MACLPTAFDGGNIGSAFILVSQEFAPTQSSFCLPVACVCPESSLPLDQR